MSNVVAFESILRQGNVEAVRRMIEQGEADANAAVEMTLAELYPNLNDETDGRVSIPALHAATVFGRLDVVQLLLEKNAHVNTRMGTSRGETPLILALEHSFFQVADALLQGGADPSLANFYYSSPLEFCCCASRAHFIPTLLRYGACIEGGEKARQTPLHDACRKRDLQSASILVEYGADVNARDGQGRSPIFGTNHDIMQTLIANGAQVNVQENDGWTPLHWSAQSNEALCCELLLSNNANIEAVTHDSSSTPLHYAVRNDGFEIVCLLLAHQRSRHGGDGVASLLLRNKYYDQNVLHRAVTAKTARFLVEQCRGEDDGSLLTACHQLMFARDYRGRTPLVEARIHTLAGVVEYLESFMNLTLATSVAASDDCMAVMLNPELDDFQRAIATECLDLVCTTCLDVSDAAFYAMLGYLSPSDVMKR